MGVMLSVRGTTTWRVNLWYGMMAVGFSEETAPDSGPGAVYTELTFCITTSRSWLCSPGLQAAALHALSTWL